MRAGEPRRERAVSLSPWLLCLLLTLAACVPYRTYPMLTMEGPGRLPVEPSGVALLPGGQLVTVAEGDAEALLTPLGGTLDPMGSALTLLQLADGRAGCDTPACRTRPWRAGVRLREEPVRWLPRGRRLTVPYNVEDLAPFGSDRVLGVTEYSTIGRRTGYRRDYVARPRRQTERLFVLARTAEGWVEEENAEIERLRGLLSDWGRATCDGDMLVEGLAWDPEAERVYVGLRRCDGPVQRVLGWNLASARKGLAAGLEVVADGVEGGAGPEEGVSGLCFASGRLWAVTAWDGYGYETEVEYGGRVHEVTGGTLHPVDVSGPFRDRPSALAVLPGPEGLHALVLFDNDASAAVRPTVTVLEARTPRPIAEQYAQLIDLTEVDTSVPLALNGFDFRWWVRDHRLGHLAAVLTEKLAADGGPPLPGAWTRAMGGLWQIRVGASIGEFAQRFPGRPKVGVSKQAVAFTDFRNTGLKFTGYRAQLSVIPRDRLRTDGSVAGILDADRDRWRVTVPLPRARPGTALVLQGFEIDPSSRADRGICLAAMEVGVAWHDAASDAVDVQATLIGGVCNDFDARGPDYYHGVTTKGDGGVQVTVHFAVVEGAPSTAWSAAIYDRKPPTPDEDSREHRLDDEASRAHLHCATVGPDGSVSPLPRSDQAPPASWLSQASAVSGPPPEGPVALRGFAFAMDPAGFDPAAARPLAEEESLGRNNYIYRYLVRVFPTATGTLLEGGMTHGIHLGGPLRDNARPSALALRVDLQSFPGLQGTAPHDIVWPRRRDDPNLLPEDGYVRWSASRLFDGEARCSPSW